MAIAESLAEVETREIPGSADAVLLYPSAKRERPLIILRPDQHLHRQRFTIAHEVGHIAIPWHIGELAYHQQGTDHSDDELYRRTEAEANTFAAEILMPSDWVREIAKNSHSLTEMLVALRRAKVSDHAVCLSLKDSLSPGHVFAIVSRKNQRVLLSGESNGTAADPPSEGSVLGQDVYNGMETTHEVIPGVSNLVHWWSFDSHCLMPLGEASHSSRDLLKTIYEESGIVGATRKKLDCVVNGIIGAVNGGHKTASASELYSILRQRFAGQELRVPIITHGKFEEFLATRSAEIASRK
jgi:hypothetical protein